MNIQVYGLLPKTVVPCMNSRVFGGRPNNSFNRSGDCVPLMFFRPFSVGWFRAARLIRALDCYSRAKVMKRITRILLGGSLLLFVASLATCYFGVGHAIRQQYPNGVPPGQDTDWIGVEWIGRGMILMLAAIAAIIIAVGLWLFQTYKRGKDARVSEGAI